MSRVCLTGTGIRLHHTSSVTRAGAPWRPGNVGDTIWFSGRCPDALSAGLISAMHWLFCARVVMTELLIARLTSS